MWLLNYRERIREFVLRRGGTSIPSNKADTGSWARWQVAVCSNRLPTHIANIKTRFSKKHEQWNSEILSSSSNRPVHVFLRGLLFTLNNTPSNSNGFFWNCLYQTCTEYQRILSVSSQCSSSISLPLCRELRMDWDLMMKGNKEKDT